MKKPENKTVLITGGLSRIGKVYAAATGFIFLASGESSFITGNAPEMEGGCMAQ
jgi:hypothetical protein